MGGGGGGGGVWGEGGGGRPLAAAHHDGSGAWSPEGRRAGLRPGGSGRVTGRAASRTWVTGCKGGSATDRPAKMSPMETRPAGAARSPRPARSAKAGSGRRMEGKQRGRTFRVSSEERCQGGGKSRVRAGGGEGDGHHLSGRRNHGRRNRKIKKKKKKISEGRKNSEWTLMDKRYNLFCVYSSTLFCRFDQSCKCFCPI